MYLPREQKARIAMSRAYICVPRTWRILHRGYPQRHKISLKNLEENSSACNASSLAYAFHNSTTRDYTFIPYDNGKECQYFLRHCFLVRAIKLGEVTVDGEKLLNLRYRASYGFGTNEDGAADTFAEYIFSDDRYKNYIISCKPVFDESKITSDDLKEHHNDPIEVMNYKWADVTTVMDHEVIHGYGSYSHNCCTVAYKAAKSINKDIGEIIDPNEINYGIGVVFTGIGGYFSASAASGVSRVVGSSKNLSNNNADTEKPSEEEERVEEEDQGLGYCITTDFVKQITCGQLRATSFKI